MAPDAGCYGLLRSEISLAQLNIWIAPAVVAAGFPLVGKTVCEDRFPCGPAGGGGGGGAGIGGGSGGVYAAFGGVASAGFAASPAGFASVGKVAGGVAPGSGCALFGSRAR